MKKIITALALAVLALGLAPIARADCQTTCYDSGNTGYHCVTTCT